MTSHEDPVIGKITALLETLSTEDRREITAWLIRGGRMASWPDPVPPIMSGFGVEDLSRLRRLGVNLASGEANQLVNFRLPSESHARLRDWCAEHGFTMATVVRGLVERFLTQEGAAPPPPEPA
jgi:hypothetical protein